jgi:hypothetical protein
MPPKCIHAARGLPALGQRRRVEVQVGTVIADEEVLRRPRLRHDGQQRRSVDALQETQVQARCFAGGPQRIAEAAAADRPGEGAAQAGRRRCAGHVPGRSTGLRNPLLARAVDTGQVGQRLAGGHELGQCARHPQAFSVARIS